MNLDPEILDFYDTEVIGRIMEKYGYSEKDACSLFLESRTYKMLVNQDMGLCQFGPAGIFDMWECEKIVGTPTASVYIRMM